MRAWQVAAALAVLVALVPLAGWLYYERIANPRVERELAENPQGERARKVMVVTLPSGRRVPVNYLQEGAMVYAGADGRWWRELRGDGADVEVLIQGVTRPGHARVVLDDPDYTDEIFSRLRPDAIKGFGTLVEIRLEAPTEDQRDAGGRS